MRDEDEIICLILKKFNQEIGLISKRDIYKSEKSSNLLQFF